MKRQEALKVKEGDVLIYKEYAVFQVTSVSTSSINKDVIFWEKDNKGLKIGYPHKACRRFKNDRTEESNKVH